MRSLYFDCSNGISGDMSVAALLDLGADKEVLDIALSSIKTDEFDYKITKVKKHGISALDFNVILKHDNHDHDMEYLTSHHHEHHHHHEHIHRGIDDVFRIIDSANITDNANKTAKRIFEILAKAEAKAHDTDIKNVHFHEVGAVDSIVDIIAFSVCVDNLGIDDVIIPSLTDGTGFVNCRHGTIPVPVPAVINIVSDNGLKLNVIDFKSELTTPTGAAICAAVKTTDNLPDGFKIIGQGIGAGKREYSLPGILRVFEIEYEKEDTIFKLETNIDDTTGEALGYTMEELFKNGALDVYYMPVYMKKNRPAYMLNVICKECDIQKLEDIIFLNTTTIGIRHIKCNRTVLPRKIIDIETKYGIVKAKEVIINGKKRIYPEYESIKEICSRTGKGYGEIYNEITSLLNN